MAVNHQIGDSSPSRRAGYPSHAGSDGSGRTNPHPDARRDSTGVPRKTRGTALRCAAVLIVLAVRSVHAADFAAGVPANGDNDHGLAGWLASAIRGQSDPQSAIARMSAGDLGARAGDDVRAARRGNREAAERQWAQARHRHSHARARAQRVDHARRSGSVSESVRESVAPPDMARIEGGCSGIGSALTEAGRHEHESRHPVCIETFFLSRYEVTRRNFAAFVRATDHDSSDGCEIYGEGGWGPRDGRSWRDPGFAQNNDHPVVCVSRHDALAYAAWLSRRHGRSYRLPTEAEWEYAARAGSSTARHWGDDPARACAWANVGDRALHRHYPEWPWTIHPCDDGYVHTAPIGSFRVNLYGLYDMVGNVWEWTCSAYDAAYRGAESRCASDESNGVVRGGSWSNSPRWARSAGRFESPVNARVDLVGFRLAHD